VALRLPPQPNRNRHPGAIRATLQNDVPAILVSGDTSSAIVASTRGIEYCHLLSKPVDADDLLELTTSLLHEPSL
jgi:hypothetical protein